MGIHTPAEIAILRRAIRDDLEAWTVKDLIEYIMVDIEDDDVEEWFDPEANREIFRAK